MKCVCERDCQKRLTEGGRAYTFRRGDVQDFTECPAYFHPIEALEPGIGYDIDFATASESELLEADYELDLLKDYIVRVYGRKAGNKGKEKTVALLMDCRFRDTNDLGLDSVD